MLPHISKFSRTWLAALSAAAVVALALLSLSTLDHPPVLGAAWEPAEGGALRLTWIMPGGYAYEAGLHPGDVVRLLPPPAGSGAWGAVQRVEGPALGPVVPLVRRWPAITDMLLFVLGLEFLLAGLLVHARATDRAAARRFAVLAAACAATFVAFPAIGSGHPWALATEWFGSKIGMAAFALFFLNTPVRRWPRIHPLLKWTPAPILALYSATVLARPDLYAVVKPMGYSYMAFGLFVSLVAMAWPFVAGGTREQRRLWPVALCAGAAAAIYLLVGILPYLLFRRYPVPAEVAISGLFLLPMGFVWAMLRYPLMGMALGPWAVVKTVFESITDPIFVVGRDGRLIDASLSGLALLGIPRARDCREPFAEAAARIQVERGTAADMGSLVERVLAGQPANGEEMALRSTRGDTIHVSVAGTPLFDERGRVEMAVLVCRDITERKRREEERKELDRQKDEFLAGVSHDLKTPLTAIKSSIGVVLANEPPGISEGLHRMLVNVDLAADRMSAMVEDLLEMARLQAGNIRLRMSRCSLREIARRAAETVEPLARGRQQRLLLEVPDEPVEAVADAGRLERALVNLLSNAHRHGRQGGTIRLSLRRSQAEAVFAVSDDGPGIPESEQERIFDRFYRVERGAAVPPGTGLGLPIARSIAELHNGRLWVESSPGRGSTFWLSIPIRQLHSEPGRVPAGRVAQEEQLASSRQSGGMTA